MKLRRLKDVLFVLALLGVLAALIRLGKGLGATTALSDEIPWGYWKVLNMVAGVALATGGFVLAFLVHVLHIRSLRPILRPALLVAFLGYGSSCTALLLDIGLPHRFWHPIFFWNEHSFLFEVFWCVLLYFTVTALEVSPIALEESPFRKLYALLRKISKPVVIAGITFSTLHHSSLGSLFLVSATRLHELWYTSWLPLLFFVSAVGGGMLSVVLVTLIAARIYRRKPPSAALRKVAGGSAVVLSIYLALKIADLVRRGATGLLFSGEWEATLFTVEILCATVVPIVLVAIPRVRRTSAGLAVASVFAVIGVAMNRVDVGIFAYFRSGGTIYVPTLAEVAVTVGIPAAAGLFFLWFVEHFKVLDAEERLPEPEPAPVTAFQGQTGVWTGVFLNNLERLTLIAVVVVPIGLMVFLPAATAGEPTPAPVEAPLGADTERAVLRIDGDRDGDAVLFDHADHQERLGGEESCAECHHLDRPGDRWTSCHQCHADMTSVTSIFDHDLHVARVAKREGFAGLLAGNRTCAICHEEGKVRSLATAKACADCHGEDMRMDPETTRPDLAPSYRDALHGSCVSCHEERAEEVDRSDLGECATCHDKEPKSE